VLRCGAAVENLSSPGGVAEVTTHLVHVAAPVRLLFLPPTTAQPPVATPTESTAEPPYAVCVAGLRGTPITDVLVVRPSEVYHIDMTVRLSAWPAWADICRVEPVTTLPELPLPADLPLPTPRRPR
jgi:hypothetical protein